MFITIAELSRNWNIFPTGVLHVGAHLGEEASDYEEFDWCPVIWIEAQPSLAKELNSKLDLTKHRVIEAAVWRDDGISLKLKIASNSQSSSLLNFGSHADSYPDITFVSEIDVITKRLDSIVTQQEMPNFINLDIQGVELPAIQSLGNLFLSLDYIYTEVNKKEVYEGCTLVTELDDYLLLKGFKRVTTRWYLKDCWGDALYIRSNLILHRSVIQVLRSNGRQFNFYFRQILSLIKNFVR